MTWETSTGKRVLRDYEILLFAYVLIVTLEMHRDGLDLFEDGDGLGDGMDHLLDNNAFDRLHDNKKIALLWKVCYYLFEDTGDDVPKLNNLNESAIFFVFRVAEEVRLPECLDFEYPTEAIRDLPCLVMKCIQCYGKDEDGDDDDMFPTDCRDTDDELWRNAIECLADLILWDRDFEADMEEFIQWSDYYVPYREDPRFPANLALDSLIEYLVIKEEEVLARLSGQPSDPTEFLGLESEWEDTEEDDDDDEHDEDMVDVDAENHLSDNEMSL